MKTLMKTAPDFEFNKEHILIDKCDGTVIPMKIVDEINRQLLIQVPQEFQAVIPLDNLSELPEEYKEYFYRTSRSFLEENQGKLHYQLIKDISINADKENGEHIPNILILPVSKLKAFTDAMKDRLIKAFTDAIKYSSSDNLPDNIPDTLVDYRFSDSIPDALEYLQFAQILSQLFDDQLYNQIKDHPENPNRSKVVPNLHAKYYNQSLQELENLIQEFNKIHKEFTFETYNLSDVIFWNIFGLNN